MEDLSPRPGDLEVIETASRDEISALQLERMKWSLTHAYENSPFYRQRFDAAGVHPSDLKTLADLGIAEIGLRSLATSDSVKLGRNLALSTATFKRENGTTATIGNVALGFTPTPVSRPSRVVPEGGPLVVPIDTLSAASNLAQAMSGFDANGNGSDLRSWGKDGMAPQDWLTAAVV